jgi:hypothetical protein
MVYSISGPHTHNSNYFCISKDSDLLVYSAASHVAFPVLFKLDRGTGSCDSICMDWLLSSPSEDPKAASQKPGSALETLLRNLGSRQARRAGYGVRLFVQACVLAGCDYAPNKLSGIGLVSAFKLIRDTAFRNDGVRFEKALDSLPRKTKQGLDIKEYELILAKSEAVFYYHLVRHLDGSTRPLSEPRCSDEENGEDHHFSDHFPFMNRFGDDWSFLGQMQERVSSEAPPVAEIVIPNEPGKKRSQMKPQPSTKPPKTSKVDRVEVNEVKNPYRSKKRPREDQRRPLSEIASQQSQTNPFARFARLSDKKPTPGSGMLKYLQKQEDVRFVKRRFPPDNDRTRHLKSKPSIGTRSLVRRQSSARESDQVEQPDDLQCKENLDSQNLLQSKGQNHIVHGDHDATNHFDYEVADEASGVDGSTSAHVWQGSVEDKPDDWFNATIPDSESQLHDASFPAESSRQEVPAFFDLTESNSGHSVLNSEVLDGTPVLDGSGDAKLLDSPNEEISAIDSSEDRGVVGRLACVTDKNSDYNLESFQSSPPNFDIDLKQTDTSESSEIGFKSRSKYFQKGGSRRVTLDPSEMLDEPNNSLSDSQSVSASFKARPQRDSVGFNAGNVDTFTPQTKKSDWCIDEIIESPPEFDEHHSRDPFGSRSSGRVAVSGNQYSSVASYKIRRVGPLESAFQRQEQISSQDPSQPRSWRNSSRFHSNSSVASAKKKSNSLTSYFQPVKEKRSVFAQLKVDTKRTEEDFLWNTP